MASNQYELGSDEHLRIYISGTHPQDWNALVGFLRTTESSVTLFVNGKEASMLKNLSAILFNQANQCLLVIKLGDVCVRCQSFRTHEINLDVDPANIGRKANARILLRLMSALGRALNKEVLLVRANGKVKPLFRYRPGEGISELDNDECAGS